MTTTADIETLKEWISYDPHNGEFFYKKSPNRNKPAGSKAGHSAGRGYLQVQVAGKRHQANRAAFLLYHGWICDDHIDHWDGNPSNNRISNLRPATPLQNQYNRKISKANTTGVKGVTQDPKSKRFHARLKVEGVQKFIGSFEFLIDAEAAVKKARNQHHGNYARHQ